MTTTIASIIRSGLAEFKNTAEILADVKAAFPNSNTNKACVSYYRSAARSAEKKAIAKSNRARLAYEQACRLGEAADAKLKDVVGFATYVYDWGVSFENASEGIKANEGIKMEADDRFWTDIEYDYMTSNIHCDCAYRIVDLGLIPADFDIIY